MRIFLPLILLLVTFSSFASIYYIDPVKGSIANDGSQTRPWNTLQAVLEAKKALTSGDIITLLPGNHGSAVITGINPSNITIIGSARDTVVLNSLKFVTASKWSVAQVTVMRGGVNISEDSNNITLSESRITSSNENVASWTAAKWKATATGGIVVEGDNNVIRNNLIKTVVTGLRTAAHANRNIIDGNIVENFMHDGMMETGDYNTFQNNRIINAFQVDGNHPDGIQAFGHGNMTGTIIKNNFISGAENHPNLSLYSGTLQGIGLFSTYKNYHIEGNTVKVDHTIGIFLLGPINSKVINNTILRNGKHAMTSRLLPGIYLYFLDGAGKPSRKATGNVVQNNRALSYGLINLDGTSVCYPTVSNCTPNVTTK